MASTLTRFTRDSISPLGTTTLLVAIGEDQRSKTVMITFIVVGLPLTYNVILDHPTLNKLRVIVSTYHKIVNQTTMHGRPSMGQVVVRGGAQHRHLRRSGGGSSWKTV
ncbi:hypothetical protein B296_00053631, partial [Ensete ventricosum]